MSQRDHLVHGLRPLDVGSTAGAGGVVVLDDDGAEKEGAAGKGEREVEKLVAVKMIHRDICDKNDRTRISFVREVEVLRVRVLSNLSSLMRHMTYLTFRFLFPAYIASKHRLLRAFIYNSDASLSRAGTYSGRRIVRPLE